MIKLKTMLHKSFDKQYVQMEIMVSNEILFGFLSIYYLYKYDFNRFLYIAYRFIKKMIQTTSFTL